MKLGSKTSAFLAAALFSTQLFAQNNTQTGNFISFPASKLTWIDFVAGIKYANVRGDLRGTGPYEAFVIFPAGLDNPYHTHSQDLPTVVLKGTFYVTLNGKRTEYPTGSYFKLPANSPHYSGCNTGVDCLLFQYQKDHFDLNDLTK